MEDAIYSVGNYLCKHKWDTFENKKKAVYSYNHSNDYAEQIVKLSEKLKPKQ
jgi:membrane-bound lytic murein transglycosylase B